MEENVALSFAVDPVFIFPFDYVGISPELLPIVELYVDAVYIMLCSNDSIKCLVIVGADEVAHIHFVNLVHRVFVVDNNWVLQQ